MITEFSHWKPEGLDKPKAVLILTPPSQSDGRAEIHDKQWQDFAVKHSLAIVGCFFQDADPSGFEGYCDVRGSRSGAKLLDYLDEKVWNGTPSVPLFLWGFSAGGQFNYEFAVNYPQYVAGFVVNKGGIYYTAMAPPNTREIPGCFIIGNHDSQWRKDILTGIHGINRVAGAKWVKVVEDHVAHQVGDSERIGREFFEFILKKPKES